MIPLFAVHMPKEVDEPLLKVLHSGYIGQGVQVDKFEDKLKERLGNPYVLTLNNGTAGLHLALRLAGVGYEDEVITTPMTCLGYLSPILLPDGSTLPIGKIVNQKIQTEVMSLNINTGELEPKKIIGWVKLPSKDVEWHRISCRNGKGSRGWGGKRGIWITGDHKVLTSGRTYKRIDQLRKSESVFTAQRTLNSTQKEVVNGTLLGDASINLAKKGDSRLSIIHTESQKEWLELKRKALRGLASKVLERPERGHSKPSFSFQTRNGLIWNRLRKKWYPHGKKIVPRDLKLSPRLLATWYLDDGCLTKNMGAWFCTEGFEAESMWRLFWKLVDFGFRPRAVPKQGKMGCLYLGNGTDNENSAIRFFELIAPFVPPSMRYKLPDNLELEPYMPLLWECGSSEPACDQIDTEKAIPPKWNKTGYVYCIEVEDNHNFISADIILSNCTASNMPILACGAFPVWADIDPKTGNIDPEKIEENITARTKAILCVHWGGYSCDLDEINKIAKKYNLKVIEDAAHAIGAEYKNKKIGTISDFTEFTFQAIKHITTVDGGLLCCKNEEDYKLGKLLRWYGIDREGSNLELRCENDIKDWGYKYHMNDIAATIGLVQLNYLDEIVRKHRANATYYDGEFESRQITKVKPLEYKTDRHSSYWLYTVLADDRDGFIKFMRDNGVGVSRAHTRNDTHTCFKKFQRDDLPGVDYFDEHQVAIPVHWALTREDREYIMDKIEEFSNVLA